MFKKLTTAFAAALFAITPLSALAQVAPGTTLVGNINQNLSSNHVYNGQRITLSNVHSPDNHINGATIYGHVSSFQAAGQGRPGKIQLSFDQLRTRSGGVYAIRGYASNVDVQTKSNALKEIGG